MRHRASHEREFLLPGSLYVAREITAARQVPLVLLAQDTGTDAFSVRPPVRHFRSPAGA